MNVKKIGPSLVFGVTVTLLVVLATFLLALITDSTKRLPGVVDVVVQATAETSAVEINWGPGLLVLFVVASAVSYAAAVASGSKLTAQGA